MLSLKSIKKDYVSGDTVVSALKGVDLAFRKSEFVSILGASGCGKTTLLNIIGGLDRYTSGDISINGVSTKQYSAHDWDTYRNHSIGFVFQSYNLIPHQTVLANVELALTLSGVSKSERRQRAKEALERVGLGDQLKKYPNQMSGGQMQRVAIARALVNNPEILLADEPTGALDSETSEQVMELLKAVSNDRLVIMVTHNPELAERYSSRIIRLHDGLVVGDTAPYSFEQEAADRKAEQISNEDSGKRKKASMSMTTAFSLSLKNLMTKKARTILTAFAGSIGIIGIALILSLSNGINNYIGDIQEDTLSSYPISIQAEQTDMMSLMASLMGNHTTDREPHENDAVYANPMMYQLINSFISPEVQKNNLTAFKQYLESPDGDIRDYVNAIQYGYDVGINAYVKDETGKYVKSDIMDFFSQMAGEDSLSSSYFSMVSSMSSSMATFQIWEELIPGKNGEPVSGMVQDQYELIQGKWPTAKNEVVLVLSQNNELPDLVLYALGLENGDTLSDAFFGAMAGNPIEYETKKWSYEDILNIQFQLIPTTDYYQYDENSGLYVNISEQETLLNAVIDKGLTLSIVGIVKPNPNATATSINGYIGYTQELSSYIMQKTAESSIVIDQKKVENSNRNVITGLPFEITEEIELTDAQKISAFREYVNELSVSKRGELFRSIFTTPSDEYLEEQIKQYLKEYDKYSAEELVNMIANNFAEQLGYSADLIRSTLSGYSKEELINRITDIAKSFIAQTYANAMEARINLMLMTPSEEELKQLEAFILQNLNNRTVKEQFVIGSYLQSTTMSAEVIGTHVATMSDDVLDRAVAQIASRQAEELYRQSYAGMQSDEQKAIKLSAALEQLLENADDRDLVSYYDSYVRKETISSQTLEEVLADLKVCDENSPTSITIYPIDFASKEKIVAMKDEYNRKAQEAGHEENMINYTDYVALLMSSVTIILNAISGVLIAFVSISLVVSSIMIGIITYISVLERTKEIGILRAIGASKRDISRVFNAETLIIGFTAGAIGILFTILLCIPINAIIHALAGITSINAALPWIGGVILVLISMFLTFIAGLIPSRIAAKKDPVIALRSE